MPDQKLSPEKQLASFLAKFTPEISSLAESILVEMRKRYPTAIELVYDNYNALAIGFGPSERASEAIFSIALFPKWVSMFFLQGASLPDPDDKLQGSGNVARHIRLPSVSTLDEPSVQTLMNEAVARAVKAFDPQGVRHLIIKSVSAKQRPRRPAEKMPRARNPEAGKR
ncbi:hypothetical protein H7849_14425 [Alloacidobacterium dinghuense]|uniref:Uncharacterized protein n=1 Tax=Alloacidobacterium dinghuense TaxID=2763107 RepID=A0A7G8BCU4_9BACT|nr:DUF1801 domain-containing protein [Alloacidobacterium dinghuense]QNI30364.1 hypothetical protein H7849_14425 [Alloacidobacterium dinghuense]